MKILYISDHSVLEYDEVQLFTDLGHDVFSCGAYRHPEGHYDLPRPGIKGATYHQDLDNIWAARPNKNELDPALIEWADVIMVMHSPNAIVQNWPQFRGKTVVWRSIGQSLPNIELSLKKCRDEGLKIVRYSPKEANIGSYIGSDAMIRFYKDEDQYSGWTGEDGSVVSFSQSLKGRRDFCHFDEIFDVVHKFNGRVYGPGNEDLGEYNGGQVPYQTQIKLMQRAGAMPYGGTWPAPYTLSFIEALMTGLPIVAISKRLAHVEKFMNVDFYEVDEILAQIGGIVCDSVESMIQQTSRLLEDPEHARNISQKQRELAVGMFGKKVIAKQWEEFFGGLIQD